jgi:hypothetical protein
MAYEWNNADDRNRQQLYAESKATKDELDRLGILASIFLSESFNVIFEKLRRAVIQLGPVDYSHAESLAHAQKYCDEMHSANCQLIQAARSSLGVERLGEAAIEEIISRIKPKKSEGNH